MTAQSPSELLREILDKCGPQVYAYAEKAAAEAAAIAPAGLREECMLAAALRAARRCTQAPASPSSCPSQVAWDATVLAKLGASGTILAASPTTRRPSLYAAAARTLAHQYTALQSLDEMLCTKEARERAQELLGATQPTLKAIREELEKMPPGLLVVEKEGITLALLQRCPLCGTALETSIAPSSCQRPGLQVEQNCPHCGWKHSYTVCKPPQCPAKSNNTEECTT